MPLQPVQSGCTCPANSPARTLAPASAALAGLGSQAADGSNCTFPIYWAGALVYDCVVLSGQPSCPTPDGTWQPCRPRGGPGAVAANRSAASPGSAPEPAPAVVPGLALAADGSTLALASGVLPRVTLGGQACLFPFVYRGQRWGLLGTAGGSWGLLGAARGCWGLVSRRCAGGLLCRPLSTPASHQPLLTCPACPPARPAPQVRRLRGDRGRQGAVRRRRGQAAGLHAFGAAAAQPDHLLGAGGAGGRGQRQHRQQQRRGGGAGRRDPAEPGARPGWAASWLAGWLLRCLLRRSDACKGAQRP